MDSKSLINTRIKSNKMRKKLRKQGRLTYDGYSDLTVKEQVLDEKYQDREFRRRDLMVYLADAGPVYCQIALVAAAVLGVGHHIGKPIHYERDVNRDKVQIENNVVKSNANISKFTGSAITVTSENDEYFVEMFGTAIFERGTTPVFSQLTYKVDEDFFDIVNKYFDIQYTYNQNGNIVQAENTLRTNLGVFGSHKAMEAEHEVFSRLAEVTQQRYDSINVIGETDEMNTAVESSVGADRLQIVNISKPRVADGYATFYMGVMRDDKLIQFGVEMPATADIALNPNSVYTRYMAGEGELVKLDEMNFSDYAHQSDNFRTIDFGDNV